MGAVYLAEHQVLRKRLAIKVLKRDLTSDVHVEERFKREAMSACAVGSPHIVEVMDFDRLPDGRLYYIMELLEGRSLDDLIKKEAPLPVEQFRDIALQICEGLHAAHEQRIVHRDLKPENIFLTQFKGTLLVKILDFGIAKYHDLSTAGTLTRTGVVFGTPHYMSPEQAQGTHQTDRRSDIYSLGVILYQMATGRLPFEAETAFGLLLKHLSTPPQPPQEMAPHSASAKIYNDIILQAMAKEPDDRFADLNNMAFSIMRIGEPATAPARQPSLGQHKTLPPQSASSQTTLKITARGSRGKPVLMALGAGALAALLAVVAAIALHQGEAGEDSQQEQVVLLVVDAGSRADQRPAPPDLPPPLPSIRLSLLSQPKGAEVFRQGQSLGKTPLTVDWPQGEVELEFRSKGYQDLQGKFPVEEGKDISVTLKHKGRAAARKEKGSPPPSRGEGTRGTTPKKEKYDLLE